MDSLPPFASPEPDITALIGEFKSCSPYTGSNWNRVRMNEDIRFTRWENQWPDGRKYDSTRKKAFPWTGASDCRVPAADEVITWQVAECFAAFWRAWVSPKAGTTEERNYAVKLVDYFVNTLMKEHLYDEVELASQYRETYGWTMLHPTWEIELELERRELRMADIVAAGQKLQAELANVTGPLAPDLEQNSRDIAQLPAYINDPSAEDQAVRVLGVIYGHYAAAQLDVQAQVQLPEVRPATLRQAVRDLRDTGKAQLPVPYVCTNRPAIWALKPWDEVFIRGQAANVQKAIVFRRDWLTETQLLENVRARNWNPKWVAAARKLKGKVSQWGSATGATPPVDLSVAMGGQDTAAWTLYDQKTDLIEVLYATYRQLDADNVPGVYLTVFHPDIGPQTKDSNLRPSDCYAEHGLLGWGAGHLPYVKLMREMWSRPIATSRGLPEIANTWQRIEKVHTDAAIDNMSISILPPINEYQNALGTEYVLGPAVKNKVQMGKEPKWMEVPSRGVPYAFEMVDRTKMDLDRYVGRDNPELPQGQGASKRQMATGKFLMGWAHALQMAANLYQEFGSDAEFARVTGAPPGWLDANRKKRNLLGASLEFDIRELDPAYVKSQMEAINAAVIPGDVAGVTNRAKWTKIQWRMVNPMLARELVNDQADASQQLYDKVQNDIALMFIGNEASYVQMDPTAQQKLSYASRIVSANPMYVQGLQQPESRFAQLMKKYAMNLQFSITEEQNKQTGAIGVQPGPGAQGPGPAAAPAAPPQY